MIKRFTFLWLILIVGLAIHAQKNIKINKAELTDISSSELYQNNGEKYYKKGIETFDLAFENYEKIYEGNADLQALNYKMGACCLFSSNKKEALKYFVKCSPEVADDYYLLLGMAKVYHHQYQEAESDFNRYSKTLGWYAKLNKPAFFKTAIEQRIESYKKACTNGLALANNRIEINITNLGSPINSRYHEYAAIQTPWDSLMYFTSTRPKKKLNKITAYNRCKEHILYSNYSSEDSISSVAALRGLKNGVNISLAGINANTQQLFFYQGKRKQGSLNFATIKDGASSKEKPLKGKANHKAYKETSISIASDGTVYCVMDRMGGFGKKDIWQGKLTAKNKIQRLQNLGEIINTKADEEAVYITPDGNTLFFSSKGHGGLGGYDIFKSVKNSNGIWQQPINIGNQINSPADELFFTPSVDGSRIWFSSVREGGFGGLDIYEITGEIEKLIALPDNSVEEK